VDDDGGIDPPGKGYATRSSSSGGEIQGGAAINDSNRGTPMMADRYGRAERQVRMRCRICGAVQVITTSGKPTAILRGVVCSGFCVGIADTKQD
jgi:hypothetical protein